MTAPLDLRYLQGVDCFNRRAFFRAHEVWEDLWRASRGPDREFYQGLIQVAVCLYHFGNGNLRGARKLYHTATAHLQAYLPQHAGLDVAGLVGDLETCCAELLAGPPACLHARLSPGLIPRCRLSL